MAYAIDPPLVPAVPVAGSDALFPVRRIWCVGRNYAEHAREMGHDPNREPPFFFAKPADAVVLSGATLPFPVATGDLHHEIELVVAIGRAGTAIDEARALDHVFGYAVGLDMTRRDLQEQMKKQGRPWCIGKAFDESAPIGALRPIAAIGALTRGAITLSVNGALRQKGDLAELIWSVAETIAALSRAWTLASGDLIFTGTPAGVGAVVPGDLMEAAIEGVGTLRVRVVGDGAL